MEEEDVMLTHRMTKKFDHKDVMHVILYSKRDDLMASDHDTLD